MLCYLKKDNTQITIFISESEQFLTSGSCNKKLKFKSKIMKLVINLIDLIFCLWIKPGVKEPELMCKSYFFEMCNTNVNDVSYFLTQDYVKISLRALPLYRVWKKICRGKRKNIQIWKRNFLMPRNKFSKYKKRLVTISQMFLLWVYA